MQSPLCEDLNCVSEYQCSILATWLFFKNSGYLSSQNAREGSQRMQEIDRHVSLHRDRGSTSTKMSDA